MASFIDEIFDIDQIKTPAISGTQSQNWFAVTTENGDVYQLTLTSEIRVESSNKVSSHKVEDKTIVSDNDVAGSRKISYNGIVTSIVRLDQKDYKAPEELLEGLDKERKASTFFTCSLDDRLKPIPDCLLSTLAYSKSNKEGLTTWKVRMEFTEVRTTAQAVSKKIPRPSQSKTVEETVNAGSSPTRKEPITETISGLF